MQSLQDRESTILVWRKERYGHTRHTPVRRRDCGGAPYLEPILSTFEMALFLFRVSLAMLMSNLGYNQKLHNISLWRQWLRTQYKPKQPFVLELKTPPGPHVLAHLCASISKNGGMEEKRPTYRCRQGSPRKASVLCRTATVSLFSF